MKNQYPNFNPDYAKSVSRDEYVTEMSKHDHLKDNDHGAIWEEYNEKTKTPDKPAKKDAADK